MENENTMPSSVVELARRYPYYVREHQDFVHDRPIGRGGFGVVWHAIDQKTGGEVAIKELFAAKLDKSLEKTYIKEVTTMAVCSSRFICQLVGFTLQHPYSIITVYQPNGDLRQNVIKNINKSNFSGTHLSSIALGIAHGLKHMHKKEMLHRDLKSTNILMDKQQMPRIGDFGISRFAPATPQAPITRRIGTPVYMSPEVYLGEKYSKPADIYCLGLILYDMAECNIPYEKLNREEMRVILMSNDPQLPFTKSTPKPLRELILKCLLRNPRDRPTAHDIYKMFAEGKVYFLNTDKKKVKLMAEKIKESDLKRKEKPPPLPECYADVEDLIAKYQQGNAGTEQDILEEEEEDKNEKNKLVPISPLQFYGKYHPNNTQDFEIKERDFNNPSRDSFMPNFLEYSAKMTDANAYPFIKYTMKFINRGIIPEALNFFYKVYLLCMHKSIKFIDLCYQFGFFSELIFTEETQDTCIDLIGILFYRRPIIVDSDIFPILSMLVACEEEFCALFAAYANNLPPMMNALSVVKHFMETSLGLKDLCMKAKFLKTLTYIFTQNKVLQRALAVESNCFYMEYLKTNNAQLQIIAYQEIVKAQSFRMVIPYDLVILQLQDMNRVDSILSYLMLCDTAQYDLQIIARVIPLLSINPKAANVLAKAAYSNQNIAIYIMSEPSWMQARTITREDHLRIMLAALRYRAAFDYILRNQSFPGFMAYLAESDNTIVLISVANILMMLMISPELLQLFTSTGTLERFFMKCTESNDGNLLLTSLSLLDAALRCGYSSAFTRYIPKLIQMLTYQNDLTTRAIIILVQMSAYPEGAMSLKSPDLINYFNGLTGIPSYSNYAYQFLNNVR